MKQYIAILVFFLILIRFYALNFPGNYVFDEQYHVPSARLSLNNDSKFYEWWHGPTEDGVYADWLHPPLFKYIQAISIGLLGDSALAWRLPSALFGLALLVIIYMLAKELCIQPVLAVGLALLNGLLLVQARVGMNDMMLAFMTCLLAFLYLYGKNHWTKIHWYLILGLVAGLSLATKWSAGLMLVAIIVLELYLLIKQKNWHQLPWLVFSLLLLPVFIYILSFAQFFIQGKTWQHLIELHQQIVWYQFNRDSKHSESSKPWQWFFNSTKVTYWRTDGLLPDKITTTDFRKPTIYLFDNPVWQALAILAVINLIADFFSYKKKVDKSIKIIFFCYLSMWLPWIFSPRIMFLYHYIPAIPFLSIILARQLLIWQKKYGWSLPLAISLIILSFIICLPLWIGKFG